MGVKKTLLEIVQEILSDMDSEEVNSLSDSVEAQQVAGIVERTFYNIITTDKIESHMRLLTLTPHSDSDYPTSFVYDDNVKSISEVSYNIQTIANPFYKKVHFLDPVEFLNKVNSPSDDYVVIDEPVIGTKIKIRNDKHPDYYTTFDDTNLIFDSYNSTVDSTLQESKIRAIGSIIPSFSIDDDYVPDLAPTYFPYLISEAKSVAFDTLKGGTTPKVEQAARRQKAYIQNDRSRTGRPVRWSIYGRT